MKFILILVITRGWAEPKGALSTQQIEFKTMTECQAASVTLKKEIKKISFVEDVGSVCLGVTK